MFVVPVLLVITNVSSRLLPHSSSSTILVSILTTRQPFFPPFPLRTVHPPAHDHMRHFMHQHVLHHVHTCACTVRADFSALRWGAKLPCHQCVRSWHTQTSPHRCQQQTLRSLVQSRQTICDIKPAWYVFKTCQRSLQKSLPQRINLCIQCFFSWMCPQRVHILTQ